MCFASAPSASQAPRPEDYEFVDSAGTVVPQGTAGAIRRLKLRQYESILGGTDSANNAPSVGVGDSVGAAADANAV